MVSLEFPEKAVFFVDEDFNRIGKTHLGLPIYSPQNCPEGLPILLPLREDLALDLLKRLPVLQKWIVF